MKKLQSLSITRLSVLEFGQHVKSIHSGITLLNNDALVTDAVLKNYLTSILASSVEYDKALLQIAKSDETAKIAAADTARDLAITALQRYLKVFELTETEAQQLAYESLTTVLTVYKGLQKWNFEEESNAIDNLITELESPKHAPHIATLAMEEFVNRLKVKNTTFKTLFEGRTLEASGKTVYDVTGMRKEMKILYTDMTGYVLSMAKATDTAQFNESLNVINTVRKYYADLLAKRKPAKKDEVAVPIAPMA